MILTELNRALTNKRKNLAWKLVQHHARENPSPTPLHLSKIFNLLLSYRQTTLALSLVDFLGKDVQLPVPVLASLLRSAMAEPNRTDELKRHAQNLITMLREHPEMRIQQEEGSWKDVKGKHKAVEGRKVRLEQEEKKKEVEAAKVQLTASLMESFLRMEKPQLALNTLASHTKEELSENPEQPPSPLVALAIKAHGAKGDVGRAEEALMAWRNDWMERNTPGPPPVTQKRKAPPALDRRPPPTPPPPLVPPSAPYVSLLNLYSSFPPPRRPFRDPAYQFIPLLAADELPMSSSIIRGLLALELSRRKYNSFWALTNKFLETKWKLDSPWARLALKAKRWEASEGENRLRRLNREKSPFHKMWDDQPGTTTPSSSIPTRLLFQHYLKALNGVTSTSRIKNQPIDISFTGSEVIRTFNAFLSFFISTKDWHAAAFVLGSFKVHQIEPNSNTHAVVVVGITRMWERHQVKPTPEFVAKLCSPPHLKLPKPTVAHIVAQKIRRQKRGRMIDSLDLIQGILERRKVKGSAVLSTVTVFARAGGVAMGEVTTTDEMPEWMAKRELRSTSYLLDVLRMCAGQTDEEWVVAMAEAKKEIAPPRRNARLSEVQIITT